ncbi:glycosyltransferase family 39 protein [Streptomyces sp. NPDC005813]|uniref:glycosyltransferase family 39 protein n=1 Tax=Streptomyces sp. NPDC005813 TaxID=3155592 RepID=UPI00340502BB
MTSPSAALAGLPRDAATGTAGATRGAVRGDRRVPLLVSGPPTVLALAVVLSGVGHRQLWRDEHATWWASTLSYPDLGRLTGHIDVVLTPFYVVMHLWTALVGTSPAALRLPGALAMAASAGLLALLGRQLSDARTGLVAGLLFAVLPTVTRYGQEARPYAFAVLFALLATLVLLRALDRPSLGRWTLYALALALTGFSHLVALSVLPAHAVAVVRARRAGDPIAHWAFGCATVLGTSAVVPMATEGAGQVGQIAWNNPVLSDLAEYPVELLGSWSAAVAVLGLGAVGLLTAGRRGAVPGVWALLPPVLTFVTSDRLHLFLPRYLLFTVPAWLLLAAAGAVRCADVVTGAARTGRRGRVTGALLLAGAVAGFAVQVWPAVLAARQDLSGEPDFAGAGRVVRAAQRPGDGILYSGVFGERKAMAYELRGGTRPDDVLARRTARQTGSYAAVECDVPADCLSGRRRLWLVSTGLGATRTPLRASTAAVLDERYRVVRTERLRHVTVRLLERRR